MELKEFKIVKLEHGQFSCEILANYGAALNSYRIKHVEFLDGYHHPEEIVTQQYKGVILAPFPNRVANAKYLFNGHDFTLDINRAKEGLALHGFLYNLPFTILKQTANNCKLQYIYTKFKNGYPFPFELMVEYLLESDGSLSVKCFVTNTGTETMPFGLGWHPYFKIEDSINELKLHFPTTKLLLLDDRKIPTGERIIFNNESCPLDLVNCEFDDCFELTEKGNQTFLLEGIGSQLEISADSSAFPFFQIYTPQDRKSIAIEPMTCAPNAFNNGLGLSLISSGATFEATFTLRGMTL